MATKRTNVTVSDEILEYYQTLADEMGVPRNSAMVIGLKTYMDQQKSLKMGDIYKAMQDLVEKLEEKSKM